MAFRVSCRTALFGKRDDVVRLKSFFSLGDHELHRLPFFQGTVAVDFDGAVMDENIAASILSASTRSIGDVAYGNMLLGIPGGPAERARAVQYLKSIPDILVEEVSKHV